MDGCPSFISWLSALLVTSFLGPLLLPLLPVLPSARAEELPELTASALQLDRLFAAEQQIARSLERLVQLSERQLQHAKRYLETYRQHNPVFKPSNPVRDYKLLQRVENLWTEELSAAELQQTLSSIQQQVVQFVDGETGSAPGASEAVDTLLAMLDTQKTYDLDVTELADGRLMGLDTGTKMDVMDLVKLAEVSCASNAVDKCLVWLEAAVEVANATNQTGLFNELSSSLENLKQKHDQALIDEEGGVQLFPRPVAGRSPRDVQRQVERSVTLGDGLSTHGALCRGRELRDALNLSKLFCKYEKPHPYLYLQPLKTEVQSIDPYICIYHDVLGENDMRQLQEAATPFMERSGVSSDAATSRARVSSSARLMDDDDPVVPALNRRIQLITGLDVTNRTGYLQEMLQVCEYGTGGSFSPHRDYLNLDREEVRQAYLNSDDDTIDFGERVATVMFYLSPVLRGGRTVFPLLGVTIEPEPGSAVYWNNVLPDGSVDERTLHAGCPVAYGYKWIANKFIREVPQTCRIQQMEQDKAPAAPKDD